MLENIDWRVTVVVFLYFCVVLGLIHTWRKGIDVKTHEDQTDVVQLPPKKPKPKFEERGEIVGTNIVHMSERLKVENIDREAQPYWPIKEEK